MTVNGPGQQVVEAVRRVEVRGRAFTPVGRFDLGQSLAFGFGQRDATPGESVMRLAFVLDGRDEHAGVTVGQRPDGVLEFDVAGTDRVDEARAQAARVLSVDVDATGWDALCDHDPLLAELGAARPGLRPPLFHSAYEAASWSVLSARRPQAQMAALRDRLAAAHGAVLDLAGVAVPAFPTPRQLLAVEDFPGLPDIKLQRLHGIARAALDGRLDTTALRRVEPAQALAVLQQLDGIGPFYAGLVVVRALGHTDVPPADEPRALALAGELTGQSGPLDASGFADLTDRWSPWRTWASVAIRAAGGVALDRRSVG